MAAPDAGEGELFNEFGESRVPYDEPAPTIPSWIVVIDSKSNIDYSFLDREAFAHSYGAFILDSDEYSSLTPGLWVSWFGPFATSDAASAFLDSRRGALPSDSYVTDVTG